MKKQKAPSAKPKAAKPARKPRVEYTPELAALVLDLLVDGKTLKEVEALPGMPSRTQVFRWRQEHEEFASSYRDALDARADGLADEIGRAHV
jgi:hypothetical protein